MKRPMLIFYICIILFISFVLINIFKNNNTELFSIFDTTKKKATDLESTQQKNTDILNTLDEQTSEDKLKRLEVTRELEKSRKISTEDIEKHILENSFTKKFNKIENRKCPPHTLNYKIGHCKGEKCIESCAKTCLDNPKTCRAFNYDKANKVCKLSSACYWVNNDTNTKQNNDFDLYDTGRSVPKYAKFTRTPNKKCDDNTLISTSTNKTLEQCSQDCIGEDRCISYEHIKDENNKCKLTSNCHKFNWKSQENHDVYMRNNVRAFETINNKYIPCKSYTRKPKGFLIQFNRNKNWCVDAGKPHRGRHWTHLYKCNENKKNQKFEWYRGDMLKTANGKCLGVHDGWYKNGRWIEAKDCEKHKHLPYYKWKIRGTKVYPKYTGYKRHRSCRRSWWGRRSCHWKPEKWWHNNHWCLDNYRGRTRTGNMALLWWCGSGMGNNNQKWHKSDIW